jgi:hypothetical protein
MALGDKKSFVLTQGGVSAEVWLEDMGSNHTQVAVKALAGTLDVNALFWDLVGGDNSLAGAGIASGNNMNGVGSPVAWDDAVQLSAPGSHADQIHVGGESLTTTITANWADIDAFGIRAGGNKMADTSVNETIIKPVDPPVDPHHNGALAVEWTFENHTQAGGDNTGTPTGFWNLKDWAHDNPGVYGTDADQYGFSTDIQVHGVDGHRALDTAASPGNIFLQAVPEGRGGVLGQGATMPDLVSGKTYHAEFMVLSQDYSDIPEMVANGTEGTDPYAWVEFNFNGVTKQVHASDVEFVGHHNEFMHFDMMFQGVAGEDSFTIQSHGTHDDATRAAYRQHHRP